MQHTVFLQVCVCVRTCFAALGDDCAQGLTDSESEVWSLVDGHAQCPGHALKGHQKVHRAQTEPRKHGPDLMGEQRVLHLRGHLRFGNTS